MIKWIWQKLCCHDWTSAAMQDKSPTKKQIDDGVDGFWDYATMYCSKCGKVIDLSKRHDRA